MIFWKRRMLFLHIFVDKSANYHLNIWFPVVAEKLRVPNPEYRDLDYLYSYICSSDMYHLLFKIFWQS